MALGNCFVAGLIGSLLNLLLQGGHAVRAHIRNLGKLRFKLLDFAEGAGELDGVSGIRTRQIQTSPRCRTWS